MKTAEELFDKYSNTIDYVNNDGSAEENQKVMFDMGFTLALTDYKQSIIGLIDERMKQDEQMRLKYIDKDLQKYSMAVAKISAYHELKQKIEEL